MSENIDFKEREHMKGVIVGISGGNLDSTDSLNKYALSLTGKKHPHVLFIPTASYDADEYIKNIENYYRKLQCSVSVLCITKKNYSEQEIETMFKKADIIYVGGGDTEEMLKIWRKRGVDRAIQKAYEEGKIMTGISAGTIIWFKYGFSDSDFFKNPNDWDYKFVKGMGNIPFAVCPHYDEDGRNQFDQRLKEMEIDGIALENNSAIVISDGKIFIKKSNDTAKVFLLKKSENGYYKREITNKDCFEL